METNPLELTLQPYTLLQIECFSHSSHIKSVIVYIRDQVITFYGGGKDVKMKPNDPNSVELTSSKEKHPVTVVILFANIPHGLSTSQTSGFFKLATITEVKTLNAVWGQSVQILAFDSTKQVDECRLTFNCSAI